MQILGLFPITGTLRRFRAGASRERLSRGDRANILAAEAARDSGLWRDAAELFESFAENYPDRHDIRIQIGNCAKESGHYGKAYEAFRSVLGTEFGRDAELQIGHLFKVTGNFRAAKAAFERAKALGDKDAARECESFGPSWLATVRFSKEAPTSERPLPSEGFRDLLMADFEFEITSPTTRRLAELSLALGETTLARGFYELAYLSSTGQQKRSDEIAIAIKTSLWSPDHILAMQHAERTLQGCCPSDARDRVHRLIAAALAEPGDDGEGRPTCTKFLPVSEPRPNAFDGEEADATLSTLVAAITKVYEAFSHYDGRDPSGLVDSIRDLRLHIRPILSNVAFAVTCTARSYRLHATRILHDRTALWLAQIEDAYLGSRAAPTLITAFLSSGRNAVAERLSTQGSPAALFDEMTAMLAGFREPAEKHDRVLTRVLTITAPDLSLEDVRSLFEEALRRHFFSTAVALVERQMAYADADVVEIATRLKQAGEAHHALALLERHLDEGGASCAARIEKALVAKTCADFVTAARLLEACLSEQPDNEFIKRELIAVLPELEPIEAILARYRGDAAFMRLASERQAYRLQMPAQEQGDRIGMSFVEDGVRVVDLAPEIATEFLPQQSGEAREGIDLIQVGWQTKRGPGLGETRPLLRRHDFVRVRTAFREPIVRLRARIDGRTVGTTTGVMLQSGSPRNQLRHSMFNCWIDLSEVSEGLHELQLYFEEAGGGYRTYEQKVWVDPSPPSREALASTATVDLSGDNRPGSLEERISRQPSAVFKGARQLLEPPRRILVMRVDQLGDLITSLPAMLRLRDCFPEAELSCLVSPNYVSVVQELGIFAEIFTLDFPYEQSVAKRHVTLARQAELRRQLGSRGFDIAIDLCFGHMSRPLLRLAQARFTVGFWPQEFPWLDFGMDVRSRDVGTGRYRLPQQAVCTMLIDGLASLARHTAVQQPQRESDWSVLQQFGIVRGTPFIVVHTGGRTRSRKWPIPHFVALAQMIVERTGSRVLVIADDPADFDDAGRRRLAHDGVHLIEHRLPFAVLDTLLSVCTLFVGNDSGPKHLAAFRGTPVVSIHGGPINWGEWGQDGVGRIVVHRVPCSGCGIELVEECGKGLACLDSITPETVFGAVREEMLQSVGERAGHGR
ncbi:glycosyltransferase family 9 protein [Inquilinus sp. NPDC058860]|uniref:glycosyltransferase family 9 protein n=1 Tax=Inquilinus sp. NPDC058860 TaxID=3346652 RepID=UPI00369B7F9C